MIDVLNPARQIEVADVSGFDFFLVQDVYTVIIPDLDAPLASMIDAVRALVARGGDDLMAARPNGAFRAWATKGARAIETIDHIDPEKSEDAVFLFLALEALAANNANLARETAEKFLAGSAAPARSAAAMALGTIKLPMLKDATKALAALENARSTCTDDNLRGHIIRSATAIAISHADAECSAIKIIGAADPDAEDQAIHQAASTLFFYAEELSGELASQLSTIVARVKLENRGTVKQIDHALSVLIRKGRLATALELLEPLLTTHYELHDFELLDGTSHALLETQPSQLANIVVKWLLSLDRNLGGAAFKLTGGQHDGPLLLDFDASALDLPDADIILLAHRTIGFLFVHPITAASMLIPLIRIASPEARNTITKILFDPLLINYSGELADWLKGKSESEDEPVVSALKNVLDQLESYLDGLRSVGRIKELRPSERERLIESHRQHESMRQLHKAVETKSVLMSLVSRSVVLYGTRSVSYVHGPNGEKRRFDTKMHSMSHSIEAPRLDILEPFDLDYTLRIFRAMRVVP